MTKKSERSNRKALPQFRSSEPYMEKCTLLDPSRAEVMLNMLVLLDVLQGKEKRPFIKALHDATNGDPKVFDTLLRATQSWSYLSAPTDRAQLQTLWTSAKLRPPHPNAMALLRRVCKRQRIMPPSMIVALFDDLSFDWSAYLKWHNRAG